MLSECHPIIRRVIRFIALPYCYVKLINWNECTVSKYQVMKDLLYIFFKLKYFPDNYSPCRLWEKDRRLWIYYYGSSYHSYQRRKLRKEVQRFEYLILFDDKEVCELLCRGLNINLPDCFGTIFPGMNYRSKIENAIDSIVAKKIIIKPVMGHAGRGIALAHHNGDRIKIKVGTVEKDLAEFKLKERSIMQEVVVQDETINRIASASVNTVRVVTLYTQADEAMVISASMRFGIGNSYVDNWSAGGVSVGIDFKTGRLKKIAYDKKGNQYLKHPDSNVVFDDFLIPEWNEVMQIAIKVQKACPFFKLLGMDIALSNNGPVLIEINPNSDLIFQEQTSSALLSDKKVLCEFAKYDLLINKYQKNLLKSP